MRQARCRTRVRRVRRQLKDGTWREYQVMQRRHQRHCDCVNLSEPTTREEVAAWRAKYRAKIDRELGRT